MIIYTSGLSRCALFSVIFYWFRCGALTPACCIDLISTRYLCGSNVRIVSIAIIRCPPNGCCVECVLYSVCCVCQSVRSSTSIGIDHMLSEYVAISYLYVLVIIVWWPRRLVMTDRTCEVVVIPYSQYTRYQLYQLTRFLYSPVYKTNPAPAQPAQPPNHPPENDTTKTTNSCA